MIARPPLSPVPPTGLYEFTGTICEGDEDDYRVASFDWKGWDDSEPSDEQCTPERPCPEFDPRYVSRYGSCWFGAPEAARQVPAPMAVEVQSKVLAFLARHNALDTWTGTPWVSGGGKVDAT